MHKARNYNLVNYMCVIAALNNMQLKWKHSLAGELETTTIVQRMLIIKMEKLFSKLTPGRRACTFVIKLLHVANLDDADFGCCLSHSLLGKFYW